MPVGYGGHIKNPKKDTRHPKGLKVEGYDLYGTTDINEHGVEVPVSKPFYFENSDYERNFLFALCTRYKSQKFMENIE